MQTIVRGSATDLRPANITEATDASYPTRVAMITKPVGAGIIDLVGPGNEAPLEALLVPYGQGADDATFNLRIIGWTRVPGDGNSKQFDLWVPTALVELSCILGASVGVANSPLTASDRFVDTITVVKEAVVTADVTNQGTTLVYSPLGDGIGWAKIKTHGCQLLEFITDLGSATASDCLVAPR